MTPEVPDNGHTLALKVANERPFKKSADPADNVTGGFNQKSSPRSAARDGHHPGRDGLPTSADPHQSNEEKYDRTPHPGGVAPKGLDIGPNDAVHDGHQPVRPPNVENGA